MAVNPVVTPAVWMRWSVPEGVAYELPNGIDAAAFYDRYGLWRHGYSEAGNPFLTSRDNRLALIIPLSGPLTNAPDWPYTT